MDGFEPSRSSSLCVCVCVDILNDLRHDCESINHWNDFLERPIVVKDTSGVHNKYWRRYSYLRFEWCIFCYASGPA